MSGSIVWIASAIILALALIEAIAGRQRNFARIGIGILFFNMIALNVDLYNETIANSVAYLGLGVLALMLLVRAHHLLSRKLKMHGDG